MPGFPGYRHLPLSVDFHRSPASKGRALTPRSETADLPGSAPILPWMALCPLPKPISAPLDEKPEQVPKRGQPPGSLQLSGVGERALEPRLPELAVGPPAALACDSPYKRLPPATQRQRVPATRRSRSIAVQ